MSLFDLGTRSAATIFAVRSRTFWKSSIAIRSSEPAGAAAGSPGVDVVVMSFSLK